MGNSKQLFLFFLLVMVKWNFAVSGYEVPMAVVSSAVLPSDDDYETEEQTELANVVMNEIPVQGQQQMVTYSNKESSSANRLLNLSGAGGSSANVYNALTTFLSQLNLTPGKTTQVEIIPPAGVKTDFLNSLMGNLKTIVPKLITNAPVSFKLGAMKNSDDTLKKIQLGIIVGPATQETTTKSVNYDIPKSNILAPINVDLTSTTGNTEIDLTRALKQGLNKAKPYIELRKPSEMVFHITPRPGCTSNDQQTTMKSITKILSGLVPLNVRTIVRGRSINNPDGTVKNIDVNILLQPTQQSSGENIEVDLSQPGEDISKTLEDTLLMIIRDENTKSFNLKIIPPIGTVPESAKNISRIVNSILIRLLPNRKPELSYKISQGTNGYVDSINVKIDTEPSSTTNNTNELKFNADLSNPTASLNEEILKILPAVKKVVTKQQNKEPVSFTLSIKPPEGVTDEYVTNTLKTMQNNLLESFPTSKIKLQARTTKDSKGNIINISVISTIEPTSQNTENQLDVDVSKSGSKLIDSLINLTPQFKKILDTNQAKDNPSNLTLNIQPPKGATDQFVRNSMNTVTTFLTKLLPDKEINVQAKATKDSNGDIINTILYITAEPTTTTEQPKNPEEITVDLSDTKVDLDSVILDILPHLQTKENDTENKPKSFFLNIIPPKGAGTKYVQDTLNLIVKKLSKYLPNDKLKIQTKLTKDNKDNIVNIGLNIIAEPSAKNEEPDKRKTININLSQPEIDIDEQIKEIIPSVQSIIKQQPNGKPVEFNLNIEPPKGATDEFVNVVINKVTNEFKKILPNKNIKIQPKIVKDSQGNVKDLSLVITIEPTDNSNMTTNSIVVDSNETTENPFIENVVTAEPTTTNSKTMKVDMRKPGVDLPEEITKFLPNLKHDVEEGQINDEPVTFEMNIQPPEGAENNFVKDTSTNVITTLSRLFPKNKIGLTAKTTKDSKGNIIDVTYVVTIQPSSEEPVEKPNQSITTPSSQERVEATTGVLQEVTTEKTNTITLDLSKPGTDVVQEITKILPNLKDEVEQGQINDQPVTFEMNIQPPKGAKDNFVNDTSTNVITTLSRLFPKNKIGLTAKTTKDSKGNIIDVTYVVTIQPSSKEPVEKPNQQTTTPSSQERVEVTTEVLREVITGKTNTITLDLSEPGTDVVQEITKILPNLEDEVKQGQMNDKPVTFGMNIQPPEGAKDNFVKNTSTNVITTLSRHFPKNKIGLTAKTTKDSKGNIIDVTYVVTIQPSSKEPVEKPNQKTTTPSSQERIEVTTEVLQEVTTEKRKRITLDLTKPGTDLVQEITKALPNLKDEVEQGQINDQPVTFGMNIQPPEGAKDNFVKDTSTNVITTLSRLFPKNKIGLTAKTTKDSKGNIIDVYYVVTIQPTSEKPVEELQQKTTTQSPQEEAKEIFSSTTETEKMKEVTEITTEKPITITVNLKKPGVDLIQEITKILPNLKDEVQEGKIKDKPVTFEMNIQPPEGAKDSFVKDTSNNIITNLSQLFPKNKIEITAKPTKDSKGNVIDVTYIVNFEPNSDGLEEKFNQQTTTIAKTISETSETTTPSKTEETTSTEILENRLDIDLSKPGSNLPEEVEEILPNIIKPIEKELNQDKPVTFSFNIEPPPKSTTDFLQTASDSLLPTISKYFPNNKVTLNTKAKKDSEGFLTDVVFTVDIEPSNEQEITTPAKSKEENEIIDLTETTTTGESEATTPAKPQEKTVDIDLSKPGSNLPEEVEEILPNIIKPLEKELNQDKPVTLSFNIEPPPKSTTDFLQTASDSLLPTLSKYFPNNKVTLKTKAKKDSEGFLTDVVFTVDIEPSNEQEITTPAESKEENEIIDLTETTTTGESEATTPAKPQEKTVNIDLSKPGSNLPEEVEEILPNIIKPLEKELNEDKPVTLSFNVEPPPKSTTDFLQTASDSLLPTISKYFPNNKVTLKTKAKKDSEGFLTDVVFTVDIEPSNEQEITTPAESKEENEIIDLTETTTTGESEATTPAKPQEKTVDIDLSKPGSNLPEEVEEILPNIIKPLEKKLNEDKPVTLSFNVEPPPKSTTDFLQTASESLLPTLSKYFPNNKMTLKTTARRDSQEFLSDVVFTVDIEPNNRQKTITGETETTTTAIAQEKNINIDLSKPGSSLPDKIDQILPNIIRPVQDSLSEGNSVNLNFNIVPPAKSTADYLQTAPQSLVPILSKYFPNNKISLKTTAKKNSQGFLTDVVLSVNIEPSNEPETTTLVGTQEENVDIDLSKTGSSLPEEVEQILPNIIKPLQNYLSDGNNVNLNFNIEPPPKTTSDFLQTAPQSLVPIVSKYFPNNKISLKTSAKENKQGFLTDVILSVNIEPSNEQKTTTPEGTNEKTLDIDLSKSGSSLPEEVEQLLPKIIEPVQNDLSEGNTVYLNFNIQPPPKSTSDFLKTAPQSLVPILSKYFPNNKISLKSNAKEDSQGYLTDVVLSVIIEPNDESQTTKPKTRDVDIDLSQPGSTLPGKMKEIMSVIANPVKKDLTKGSAVTLNFNIDPPPYSTTDFLQTAPQSIVSILSDYFPTNKMSLKTSANKNSQGYLSDVTLSITIEPSEEETSKENQKGDENIDIDLSKAETSLSGEVMSLLPTVLPNVQAGLKKQQPMTIAFNIQPPQGATQNDLQTYSNSLMSILSSYFSNNEISVKTEAQTNSQGYLSFVTLLVTINPASAPQEESNGLRINLDFSNQYTSMSDQVNQVMPSIVNFVQSQAANGQSQILYFDIKLPRWVSEEYIKSVTNYLQTRLKKSFPHNQLQIHISKKEGNGGVGSVLEMKVTLMTQS